MGQSLFLAGLDSKHRREEGIAIVRGAATVELALFDHGVAGVGCPALAEGLFVHVTIEKNSLSIRGVRGTNINNQEGGTALVFELGQGAVLQILGFSKSSEVLALLKEIAISLPLRIIQRCQRRYPHKFYSCINNKNLPFKPSKY